MSKISFDPEEEGGVETVRAIILLRLREDQSWNQFGQPQGFDKFVDYIGDADKGRLKLGSLYQDILWEFIIQGVIFPGINLSNSNLPWFHLTEYGRRVLEEGRYLPHDPTGYIKRFRTNVINPDPVVVTYLTESLECFRRGNLIASIVMLGIASERMLLLLCSALLDSLSNGTEKEEAQNIFKSMPIKPKLDWVTNKIENLQRGKPRPLPDDVNIMLIAIFNFIRRQRNDLGHPQESPPEITREQAFANLEIFPSYCSMANQVVEYFHDNRV